VAEAAEQALEAAHWADEAGDAAFGAWARQMLGGFLLRQGRPAEAAEVLESALADLSADTHGDGAVVQTQWWLGDALSELGEHRAAAERRLQAAEIARHWPEQQDHATLAHLAAESLGEAGLHTEADRAYARAGAVWRELGDPHGVVRSLRARAWLALHAPSGADTATELMEAAVQECAAALDAADDEQARHLLTTELGDTHRQFGDLLTALAEAETEAEAEAEATAHAKAEVTRTGREAALARLMEAVAVFAALGDAARIARTDAELAVGRLALDLGRPAQAQAHARAVAREYAGREGLASDPAVEEQLREAARLLRQARRHQEP
jgi:tetratricopeptide (TPR) repeat protein